MLTVYSLTLIILGCLLLYKRQPAGVITGATIWITGLTVYLARHKTIFTAGLAENLLLLLFLFTWLPFIMSYLKGMASKTDQPSELDRRE